MPKYTVVQPVEHDHIRTETGEIDIPEEAAGPLIASGAIAYIAQQNAPDRTGTAPGTNPASRTQPSPAPAEEDQAPGSPGIAE